MGVANCCPAADEPEASMQVLRDAYYFLQENGYINFGVLTGEMSWLWWQGGGGGWGGGWR
jgi:hypothetical protein